MATLAPQFGCRLDDLTCLCTNKDLSDALYVCSRASCTIREGLTALRISAISCDAPVRNRAWRSRIMCWTLFGISLLFVALRFWSRSKRLDGPGFGWDDWVMLAVLAVLVPQTVVYEQMLQHGSGQDLWM